MWDLVFQTNKANNEKVGLYYNISLYFIEVN